MTIKAQMHGEKFKIHCIRCGGTHFKKCDYQVRHQPTWYECENCGLGIRSNEENAIYNKAVYEEEGFVIGSNLTFNLERPHDTYNPLDNHEGALERITWLKDYIKANQPHLCTNDESMKCLSSNFATDCTSKCPLEVFNSLGIFEQMLKGWRKYESEK